MEKGMIHWHPSLQTIRSSKDEDVSAATNLTKGRCSFVAADSSRRESQDKQEGLATNISTSDRTRSLSRIGARKLSTVVWSEAFSSTSESSCCC